MTDSGSAPRQRLTKSQRHSQLLEEARELIRMSGTDAFSLGRLADRAGVTKPLVYDHFGDRAGVLAELYRDFEARQRETLATALEDAPGEVAAVSRIVAAAYIDCSVAEGRELADVVAALSGSPTLRRLRHEAEAAYLQMCRDALEPLSGPLDSAGLLAIVGAGDALSRQTLEGSISVQRARAALTRVVAAIAAESPTEKTEEPS